MEPSILLKLLPQMPLCWYGSNRGGDIPNDPGAYLLEIFLKKAVQFSVSRLGNQLFGKLAAHRCNPKSYRRVPHILWHSLCSEALSLILSYPDQIMLG